MKKSGSVDFSTGEFEFRPKFKTPYNAKPTIGEVNLKPSETVPDQSMSVKELISRYQRGLPLGGHKVPTYEEDDNIDNVTGRDIRTMDISEIHDEISDITDRIKDSETNRQKRIREKKEKDQENEYRKKFDQEQKDKDQAKPGQQLEIPTEE